MERNGWKDGQSNAGPRKAKMVRKCANKSLRGRLEHSPRNGSGLEKASHFADKDHVTWEGEVGTRTNVDEYRLLG